MQNGIPNTVENGAEEARKIITGSNMEAGTVNQGSPLTPGNTDSGAQQSAPKDDENTQIVQTPAPVTPKEESQPVVVPTQSEIVLAGKYRKEVPELNHRIRSQESTIEILQSQVTKLTDDNKKLKQRLSEAEKSVSQQASTGQNDPKSLVDALNPSDFDMHGEEFVNLVKVLKDSFSQIQIQPNVQQQPVQQKPKEGPTPEQTEYQNILYAALGVDTFHDINVDPRFVHEFLNQINPETSRYYRSDLKESHENLNPAPVIRIFNAFIDSIGGRYTKSEPQRHQNVSPDQVAQQQNVAPKPPGDINNVSISPNLSGRSQSLSPVENVNKNTYTKDQIDGFFKSITPGKGKYAGPEHAQWAADTKADIMAAFKEGRVIINHQ